MLEKWFSLVSDQQWIANSHFAGFLLFIQFMWNPNTLSVYLLDLMKVFCSVAQQQPSACDKSSIVYRGLNSTNDRRTLLSNSTAARISEGSRANSHRIGIEQTSGNNDKKFFSISFSNTFSDDYRIRFAFEFV